MKNIPENRLIVDAEVDDFNLDMYRLFDNRTPSDIIENLKDLITEYSERDIYFRVFDCEYDCSQDVRLYERRLETDKEYNTRIEKEKKLVKKEKKKEDRERREYERLKLKFGEK